MKNKIEDAERFKKIQDILDSYDTFDSPEIGLVITTSIEYLIQKRNYDFDKMLETIKRCHNKIEKSGCKIWN